MSAQPLRQTRASVGSDHAGLQDVPQDSPQREEAERFIDRIFAERFGAQVRSFAPHLVVVRGTDGDIVAAAGWREASAGPLYLERYLDRPVHELLGLEHRQGLVEVGHLASDKAGEGRRLILHLACHLAAKNVRWVVSTLTEELRHLFMRMSITPLALGYADPGALGEDAHAWGTYYSHQPMVLAGQLPQVLRWIQRTERARMDTPSMREHAPPFTRPTESTP
jgi:hypothetical protein